MHAPVNLVLAYAIKIKDLGGDYNEAILQLGIWCSAGLRKLKAIGVSDHIPPQKLSLDWTVIWHEGRLHISWRDDTTDDVVVLGPWTLLTASTGILYLSQSIGSSGCLYHAVHIASPFVDRASPMSIAMD
jgi:hypothetical protein